MKQKLSYGLTFLLLAMLAGYLFASVGGWDITSPPNESWLSGSKADPAWNWMKAADKLIELGANPGTGSIFYVDSGVTTAAGGTSWETAVATIDEAVNLCTHDAGDYILVAQGHSETFITQSLDLDIRGVTLIGLGNGSLRPTLLMKHTAAEVAIGADNVSVRGIRFKACVTGVLMGIEVEDSVDYFTIEDCVFDCNKVGTDEFMEAINFVNNNASCTIRNNRFNMGASGAAHAIFCDADTADLQIIGNDIRGDYSVACIGGDTAAVTDVLIMGNILINGSLVADTGINAVAAISLLDASAGLIANNTIVSDVATGLLMRVADDCVFVNNFLTDTDGDEFSGTAEGTTRGTTVDANSIAGFADGD